MPLVIVCGYPCSGKSTRAKELHLAWNSDQSKVRSKLLQDKEFGYKALTTPYYPSEEKNIRGSLLAATERGLNKTDCLIVDASHEIKGWRYQMYCLARALPTPHIILFCATSAEECKNWNQLRPSESDRYSDEIMDQLMYRFEFPDPKVRWDSPLFTIRPSDTLPMKEIYAALYESSAAPPHLATQPKSTTEMGYTALLDRVTTGVLNHIQTLQATGSTVISSPSWPQKLTLSKPLSLAEGQRFKRQFLALNRQKQISNEQQLLNAFIEYLGVTLSSIE